MIENLVAKIKLRFYPRNIGMWRKTFTWDGISEPSKLFDSEESFRQFCAEHGVRFDDSENPFMLIKCNDHVSGKQYAVHQWSTIGWINYE